MMCFLGIRPPLLLCLPIMVGLICFKQGKFQAMVVCFILGLGSLVAWNSMLTVGDYYYTLFPVSISWTQSCSFFFLCCIFELKLTVNKLWGLLVCLTTFCHRNIIHRVYSPLFINPLHLVLWQYWRIMSQGSTLDCGT